MVDVIEIAKIRQDGGTQPREQINLFTVSDYADSMRAGVKFPDVVLFFDGTEYWLADGFHRVKAATEAGLETINADVRQGTLQDAQWHSFSANSTHGLRRTNKDIKRAVESALAHPYSATKSLREIAKHCGVHWTTVENYRKSSVENLQIDTRTVTRNGKTYEMDTANIGKPADDEAESEIAPIWDRVSLEAALESAAARDEAEALQAAIDIRIKRAALNERRLEEIRAQPVIVPAGKFQCIVIDPPWPMERIHRDLYPEKVGFDYPTMTEEELMACPYVPEKAAGDCHLYLWTTHRFLPMAFRLAEHWGFRYQCLMTWIKNEGMVPYSWMYSTEHVLFCRKGGLQLDRLGLRLDFASKKREQSRKPDEFYDLVRQASPGPRIDIFSREQREGFEQLGFAEEIAAFAGGQ